MKKSLSTEIGHDVCHITDITEHFRNLVFGSKESFLFLNIFFSFMRAIFIIGSSDQGFYLGVMQGNKPDHKYLAANPFTTVFTCQCLKISFEEKIIT